MLKSQHSRFKSNVLFRNCTQRFVDVIWIGFSGEFVNYGTLKPTDCKMMNTFATHPWIFRDPDTGERMHVHGKSVFMPVRRDQRNRYLVPITFPLRSLRDHSIWAISRLITSDSDLLQLELPRCLINDIQEVRQCTEKAREFRNRQRNEDDDEEA